MANIINLKSFTDKRGNLTVVEKIFPFSIQRIFYIYGVDNSIRGNHRHHKTIQAAVAIQGSCTIISKPGNYKTTEKYILNNPSKCLLLYPEDFHTMSNFTKDCILMVFSSEFYDKDDYIFEPYF